MGGMHCAGFWPFRAVAAALLGSWCLLLRQGWGPHHDIIGEPAPHPQSLLGEPKLTEGDGGVWSTDASSSWFSNSPGPWGLLSQLLILSGHSLLSFLCSLNVFLGKASNPGFGRSWLRSSAMLIRAQKLADAGTELRYPCVGRSESSVRGGGKKRTPSLDLATCYCYIHSFQMCFWVLYRSGAHYVQGGRGSSQEALFIFIMARGSILEEGGVCRAQQAWQESWVRGAGAGLLQGAQVFGRFSQSSEMF